MRLRKGIAIILAGLLLAAPVMADTCVTLAQEGHAAWKSENLAELETLLTRALGCPDEQFTLSLWAAGLAWNEALAQYQAGASEAQQKASLERVLTFAPLWQAHAALGDMAANRREHGTAANHYQEALDAINSAALTPAEPPAATIEALFRKAQTSRLLAPDYVPTTRSRSGEPAGLAGTHFRNIVIRKVALPIHFEMNSTALTPKGEAAVADLLDYLTRAQPATATLIGHACAIGDPDYNRRLSRQRAEAVANWLRQQGFSGHIQTEGRGSEVPFEVDDPARYTQAERYEMDRRVELRR